MTWIVGDRSASETLTVNDRLYETHINQLRESNPPTVVVARTANAQYACDGTADNVELQAALDFVNSAGGGLVFVKAGTYNLAAGLTVGSKTTIMGEGQGVTILKKNAGINGNIISNKDSTLGNSFIAVLDMTLDQQGALQSANGAVSMIAVSDSMFRNVYFEKSYVFNLFFGSQTGTALTGTLTFTNGDSTVTGSGTAFTTELAVGTIIKSAGSHFQRVRSITSNTSLELDRAWGWATESGVAGRSILPNARNKLMNCTFNGTIGVSDNVGLGLFDDSLIEGCISRNSTGYGFGPDHTNRARFINNTCYSNSNAGIGMETCGYCVVANNELYRNGVGVYLLSGPYRNVISNNQCNNNTNGITVSYNTTAFPKGNENDITGNVCEGNSSVGINVDGVDRTAIRNNRVCNNGVLGIRIQTGNASIPDKTMILGNVCYDNQDTKTQQRGIYVNNGTNTLVSSNISFTSEHTTAGITDSGTTTTLANNVTA